MKSITVIDTLYAYAPLSVAEYFYHSYVKNEKCSFLGVSHGREWYSIDGNRIGICSDQQALKMNSFPFLIQYSKKNCHKHNFSSYCPSFDYRSMPIQRIDTAVIFQKSDFVLEMEVISPFRSRTVIGSTSEIETMYLGKRSTGKVLRIYNKSLEMDVNSDYSQMDMLSNCFDGNIQNLFTIELELHRKFIMSKFGNVTIGSMANLVSYSNSVLSNVVFFPNTSNNLNRFKNKNYDDIYEKFSVFAEDEFYVATYDRYSNKKPSVHNLVSKIKKQIVSYVDNVGIEDLSDYLSLYTIIFNSILDSDRFILSNIDFTIEDIDEDMQLFYDKMLYLSENQTNDLEIEFKKYFLS